MSLNEKQFYEFDLLNKILSNATIVTMTIHFSSIDRYVNIEFSINFRKDYSYLRVLVKDLITVSINQNLDSINQQLHAYKFFFDGDCYYLSLDPDEMNSLISEDDQDVFIFRKLEAIII